jgi:3D (Asp-Asp-Asp) domain-containing protein
MKTRKIVSGAAIAFFAAAFFVGSATPAAQGAVVTNTNANVAIGQQNLTSGNPNQDGGASPSASSLAFPRNPFFANGKLIVADEFNNRVLIYNSIPTSDNAVADIVIGQPDMTSNSINQSGTASASTLNHPTAAFFDGSKLFIADSNNNRILIYNSLPTASGAAADVVVGQPDMSSISENQGGSVDLNKLSSSPSVFSNGKKLFISDWGNNRVLIYNSIPTANNANADVVIGQPDMTSNSENQGGNTPDANTLKHPNGINSNGKKFFIADQQNHRVLIYNSIPTKNNAKADVVIGQSSMTSNGINQDATPSANTMYWPVSVFPYGSKLLVTETGNNRALVFNSIPTKNNSSADVVIGQSDMTSSTEYEGATVAANTLTSPRGIFVANQKLFIADYWSNRVLVYNSFGPQWIVKKNKKQVLSGDEKMKVAKSRLEFSGKNKDLKKGYARIYRDGTLVKSVKIKNSGKWSAKFKDTGSAVKDIFIRYYNSHDTLQMNSETYSIGINRGSLSLANLEKMSLSGTENSAVDKVVENSKNKNNSKIEGAAGNM